MENCTPSPLQDFPPDIFTHAQRLHGAVLLHLLLAFYCFVLIAIICNSYFLPSVNCICSDLNVSEDVAGATFMAMATSTPELFVNVIGTFITESDIGIGTVVGSAVFNTLGVAACAGLAARKVIDLEWWPLTRDSVIYLLTVILLSVFVWDSVVYWWEAAALLACYFVYFGLMCINKPLAKGTTRMVTCVSGARPSRDFGKSESEGDTHSQEVVGSYKSTEVLQNSEVSKDTRTGEGEAADSPRKRGFQWRPPGGVLATLQWSFLLPAKLVLFVSVPDCREERWRRFYVLTFAMCVVWIGAATYLVSWMLSVFGDTVGISSSVMGLTFLAFGGSIPEGISAIIMARKGEGGIGMSNSMGANTLDILLCLGLPWLIKCLLSPSRSLSLVSEGLVYSCIALMVTIFLLYFTMLAFKFRLQKQLGFTCLLLYILFIVFAVLVESNVFMYVNPPMCKDHHILTSN